MNFLKNLFRKEPKTQQKELFSSVIGYDDIKEVLSLSLASREPVNILLSGPPACSKTVFLLAVSLVKNRNCTPASFIRI